MDSSICQNLSNSEEAFHGKKEKEHRGHVVNLKESIGRNDFVIMDYQFEQNIYSGS